MAFAESDVQSEQVRPAASLPSAVDPVMMSCSTGAGEPVHWPLMRCPCSSTNSVRVPCPRVELGKVVRDEQAVRVVPRPRPDPVPRVSRPIAVGRIVLDAEIGAPVAAAVTRCNSEPLARQIRSCESTKIARYAGRTAHEEAGRLAGGSSGSAIAFTTGGDDRNEHEKISFHWLSPRVERRFARGDCQRARSKAINKDPRSAARVR